MCFWSRSLYSASQSPISAAAARGFGIDRAGGRLIKISAACNASAKGRIKYGRPLGRGRGAPDDELTRPAALLLIRCVSACLCALASDWMGVVVVVVVGGGGLASVKPA